MIGNHISLRRQDFHNFNLGMIQSRTSQADDAAELPDLKKTLCNERIKKKQDENPINWNRSDRHLDENNETDF